MAKQMTKLPNLTEKIFKKRKHKQNKNNSKRQNT